MAKRNNKPIGRGNGRFLLLPEQLLNHPNYLSLSAIAVKLFIDLGAQYYGKNNGDLCIAYSLMEKRGWKSKGTLHKAKKELIDKKFIEVSRQGGKHKASLYALTFKPIDVAKVSMI